MGLWYGDRDAAEVHIWNCMHVALFLLWVSANAVGTNTSVK